MTRSLLVSTLLAIVGLGAGPLAAEQTAAVPAFRVTDHWQLGGAGGWDYLTVDTGARRLYVTRGDRVVVLDLGSGKAIGEIKPTDGVHGVALDSAHGRGYASNGKADSVAVFDLKTLAITATIKVPGHNPDAILFDAPSQRVLTFNGRSHDASVIDVASGKVVATIALSGKPEFAVSDGHGKVFVNIEDRAELVTIDPAKAVVTATWKLADCEEPTGLALDGAHDRLFSVCQNGTMVVTDASDGHAVATLPIGQGPDGVAFDPDLGLAFSSNGGDGTLTVVHERSANDFELLANLPTQRSARTIALDPTTHRLFLSAAVLEEATEPGKRPAAKPDSFSVVVVAM